MSRQNASPETASRPFDARRDGIVMGEGAGFLVLEEAEHARRRGADVVAEVAGYGTTCDAYRITDEAPDGRGAHRPDRPAAVARPAGDAARVARRPVAGDLGNDLRAAARRVLRLLEDEKAGPLPHHEPVAARVERPARRLGRRVLPGHDAQQAEQLDLEGRHDALGATRECQVDGGAADRAVRLPDGLRRRGARGLDRRGRALDAEEAGEPRREVLGARAKRT